MTKDEILALTPDQLRAEIARRKGWKTPGTTQTITREMALDAGDPRLEGREIEWLTGHENDLPDWTGDLNTAWALAEEMNAESGVDVSIGLHEAATRQYGPKYAFVYSGGRCTYETSDLYTLFFDDVAPVAICRGWVMWDERRREVE